ncbi:DUF1659 domain-containing protein [Lactobacillus acetotolerans]|jgi:hypothetical protein|uniref:DUF1659 domain-containing protein n=1 Tax=Lactobacillus acetotolerans TaxID=1600 RepID=UPI00145243FE|nr:DUF1659 domain-containing protein [Lactobacillus acetotolerans]MBN7276991.1 DUF1659 domain-containing protein [Lactobacillus acetotolerans]QJD72679.1 DUF1659 domain-containing protein [Lactobacillus acetotolerans]
MNFELLEQSIQYTFNNGKYGEDGFKKRIFKNVKRDATADGLAKVGSAIASLQDDSLGAATLIQKQGIPLVDQA